jgi:prepilin-type N-terminal cleavage/methylation domain-containing protein
MLSRFHKREGFTLIELMIVIAIIGILAAIAIPQFSAYRTRSYNSAAQSDLRNLATAQEAYFVDENTYGNVIDDLASGTYGYQQSGRVIVSTSGDNQSYTITAYHETGDKTYTLQGPGGVISSD